MKMGAFATTCATVANASCQAGLVPAGCGMDSQLFYSDDAPEAREPLGLRPRQAAKKLGISVSTLERLTKAGEIPRVKGRKFVVYRVATLDAWLASREVFEKGGAA